MADDSTNNIKTDQPTGTSPVAWGIAALGFLVTVLWQSSSWNPWHSMVGFTMLLLILSPIAKSRITRGILLAYSAITAICSLMAFGIFIDLAITLLPINIPNCIVVVEVSDQRFIRFADEFIDKDKKSYYKIRYDKDFKEAEFDIKRDVTSTIHLVYFVLWLLLTGFITWRGKQKLRAKSES